MAHPNAHDFLPERGTCLCRACRLERNHYIHELAEVEVAIGPLSGYGETPHFSIQIKDGTNRIALVYVPAEDFALALAGRLVKGKLSKRYEPGK